MTEAPPASKQRHLFIDLYRSAVILLMLEGHVVRAFLDESLRHSAIYQFHEFFHGLTAPAFLFGAGLTFVISTRGKWVEYHHWDQPLARRVGRLIFVLLLGVWIHAPFFSIRKIIIDASTEDYLQLFQSDVLTCIGLGLLSLHALVFFFKREKRFYALVLFTIASVCFLTPIVWDIDWFTITPPILSQLMSSAHGSPFPLFPFVGFLFAGVIVSWEFLVAVEAQQQRRFMTKLAIGGVAIVVVGLLADALPVHLYPSYDFWYTSPWYFFIRLGALMMIVAGVWYIAEQAGELHPSTTVLGKESLFIYVLHLFVLYGSAMNPELNLVAVIGRTMNVSMTIGLTLVFILAMLLWAIAWHYVKTKQVSLYRIIQVAVSGLVLFLFFTNDY